MPVTVTTHVAAPPDATFAAFSDIDHAAGRISAIKRVEKLTPGPVGVGTAFKETRVMFGKEATETMTFAEFDPPRGYTFTAESCGCRYITRFGFEPDAGGTRVTAEFGHEPLTFGARVMGVLMGWMMTRMIRKCFAQDLAELKKAAETTAVG